MHTLVNNYFTCEKENKINTTMKTLASILIIAGLLFIGCEEEPTSPNLGKLSASPVKKSFKQTDSVEVAISNSTTRSYYFTQCSATSIEATVQKKENNSWVLFTMSACPGYYEISNYRISPDESFAQKMKFNSNGTYRLLFRYGTERNGISDTLYSTEFSVTD